MFGISSGRPFDSDSTPASFGKVRISYLPSFKPYDEDLVKRLINSLSVRWVRSEVNIPHQSAIPEDMRPRGYAIARSEGIEPHPIKATVRRKTQGRRVSIRGSA